MISFLQCTREAPPTDLPASRSQQCRHPLSQSIVLLIYETVILSHEVSLGTSLPPRRRLALSGDIFGCHN